MPETTLATTKPYTQTINTLRTYLPHLKNVSLGESRWRDVKVDCYGYSDGTLSSVQSFSTCPEGHDEFYTDDDVSLRGTIDHDPPRKDQLRLIIAEDLSTELISCLGSSLNISPEVFEEHLLNSGWRNGQYDDEESSTWITRDMAKPYTSLRWFRPVKRKLQRPYFDTDWQRLLTPSEEAFSWTESVHDRGRQDLGVQHKSTVAKNIVRAELDLKTDSEASAEVGDLTAWEERATVWSRQSEGGKTRALSY